MRNPVCVVIKLYWIYLNLQTFPQLNEKFVPISIYYIYMVIEKGLIFQRGYSIDD